MIVITSNSLMEGLLVSRFFYEWWGLDYKAVIANDVDLQPPSVKRGRNI